MNVIIIITLIEFLVNYKIMKANLRASPETIMILPLAIMGDLIGIILLLFGLDDCGITDLVITPILTIWIMIKRKDPTIMKKVLFRLLGYGTIELIPYLGGIFPGYSLIVIQTILQTQKAEKDSEEIILEQ